MKYIEVASYSISKASIRDGTWKSLRRGLREKQSDDVAALSMYESVSLWFRAFAQAMVRKIRHR